MAEIGTAEGPNAVERSDRMSTGWIGKGRDDIRARGARGGNEKTERDGAVRTISNLGGADMVKMVKR